MIYIILIDLNIRRHPVEILLTLISQVGVQSRQHCQTINSVLLILNKCSKGAWECKLRILWILWRTDGPTIDGRNRGNREVTMPIRMIKKNSVWIRLLIKVEHIFVAYWKLDDTGLHAVSYSYLAHVTIYRAMIGKREVKRRNRLCISNN